MSMDKHLLYILVFADMQKIHVDVDMITKQLIREVEQVTTQEIIREIVSQSKVDEIYKILSDMILEYKEQQANLNAEYRACLRAINKINNGKNDAIDALSTLENYGGGASDRTDNV